ncbi:F-box/LRR-repeat protein [Trifolium pratense]|uniref:F-box/LRR-repeat protein n=1 Tax=Trifolium pratense TaxID=57577 RepID=A0A2K3P1B2_TRIPR|nr:F-box/LRR-repeat protein [Trifolium pratense]
MQMAEMDDWISELPDETLSHVISFLPSENAFATHEISKRWRPLWLLCPSPNLDFDDQRVHHQPIKSFCLRCHSNTITAFDVVMWLIDAAKRGMEYLDLHMPDTPMFYYCVFNFRNLVVLKLKGIQLSNLLSAHLPRLRTLHLKEVHFIKLNMGVS